MTFKIWRTSKHGKIMFWVEKPVCCTICHEPIGTNAVHILDWSKAGLFEHLFHIKCRESWKPHPYSVVPERKLVYACDAKPVGAVLVSVKPPTFCACNRAEASMFAVDNQRLLEMPADSIKDNTRYAFTGESLAGATIGLPSAIMECEALDKPLHTTDGLLLLEKLAAARPMIGADERKLLRGV